MTQIIVHKPLPARTQLIADVIGRDRALYLVTHWKKTATSNPKQPEWICIYIPHNLKPDHELVRVMGWSDAAKLVKAFRGEILSLSTCEEVFRDWRNQAIRRLAREQKMKTAELAEWFDIGERQVRNVLREMPIEARYH
jgi:hypothetical protein